MAKHSKKKGKKKKKKKSNKGRPTFPFLAILITITLTTFITFSPALDADFVYWDDDVNVYENPNVEALTAENIKNIFTEDVIGNYNPLPILTFAIENSMFGMDPYYFHFNNILLHILGCVFIYFIGFKMGLNRWAALLLSLLFAIHPMRTESVVWITERKDVLFGLFYWASLLLYVNYKRKGKTSYYWFALLIFPLALLSKIQAVALPLSMLCIDYFMDKKINWKQVISKWPFFLLSLITGLMGIYFLSEAGSLNQDTGRELFNIGERIIIGAYSYMIYLYKLIIPYPMSPMYPYPSSLVWAHYTIGAMIIPFLAALYVLWKKNYYAWVFGILFFTVNVIFVLQVVGAGQGYLADRFTYIGYFGFFFVAAYYFEKYGGIKNVRTLAITVIILLVYIFMAYQQSQIWKNSETMWTKVIQHEDKTTLPFRNRGNYYRDNQMTEKALKDYSKSIQLDPEQDEAYNSRGRLYFQQNQLRKALADYNKAIEMNPNKVEYYSNRGATYARLNQVNKAMQDLNKAIEMDPPHIPAYLNRALLYDVLNQPLKAMKDLEVYVNYNPNQHDLWYNIGYFAAQAGQDQKAVEALNRAIQLNGTKGEYYQLRAKMNIRLGNLSQARQDAQSAAQYGTPLEPSWQQQLNQ